MDALAARGAGRARPRRWTGRGRATSRTRRRSSAPRRARSWSCPTSRSPRPASACRSWSATPRPSGSSSSSRSRPSEAAEILRGAPSVRVLDLPAFPTPPPPPGIDEVLVGRIRRDDGRGERPRALPLERQPPQGRSAERDPDRRAPARLVGACPGLAPGCADRPLPRRGDAASPSAVPARHAAGRRTLIARRRHRLVRRRGRRAGRRRSSPRIPGTLAVLGDLVYDNGTARSSRDCFCPPGDASCRGSARRSATTSTRTADATRRRRGRSSTSRAGGWYSYDDRRLARRSCSTRTATRSAGAASGRRSGAGCGRDLAATGQPAARSPTGTTPGSAPGCTAPTCGSPPFWNLLAAGARRPRAQRSRPRLRAVRPAHRGFARSSSAPAGRAPPVRGDPRRGASCARRHVRRPAADAAPARLQLALPAGVGTGVQRRRLGALPVSPVTAAGPARASG